MPTYDYRCTSCGDVFEVARAMTATNDECCPTCGASAARVFSPVGVAFKGSGFHNTDYRSRPAEEGPAPNKPEAPACPAAAGSSCAGCPAASE